MEIGLEILQETGENTFTMVGWGVSHAFPTSNDVEEPSHSF